MGKHRHIMAELKRLVYHETERDLINGDLVEVTLQTSVEMPITVTLEFFDANSWIEVVKNLGGAKLWALNRREVKIIGFAGLNFVR